MVTLPQNRDALLDLEEFFFYTNISFWAHNNSVLKLFVPVVAPAMEEWNVATRGKKNNPKGDGVLRMPPTNP